MPGLEISFLQGKDCYRDYRLVTVEKTGYRELTRAEWVIRLRVGILLVAPLKNVLSSLIKMCNVGPDFKQILITFIADEVIS